MDVWYSTCMYIYDHIYVKEWIEISSTTENLPRDAPF